MAGKKGFRRATEYVEKGGKRLRCGFTTGSCAAAAAAAAAQMLLTGERVAEVKIETPGGLLYTAQILEPVTGYADGKAGPSFCRCAVRKDGGDDPDITTGTLIAAEVSKCSEPGIVIEGGEGIGRVTKPGLDQPVGEAAINRVPRRMIEENVGRVLSEYKEKTGSQQPPGLHVIISAPEGEALAAKTFNPRLGIEGGISILGTTGIVEPMSRRAVAETIRAQMKVKRAEGNRYAVVAPGNYGLSFLTERYGLKEDVPVLISNLAAESAEIAAEIGFEGILLAGHIGKLVKVAGGVRNTHSMYGDRRMEILLEIAEKYCGEDARGALRQEISGCVMTDAALEVLDKYGVKEPFAQEMARRICENLREWSGQRLRAETIVFANRNCELVRSLGAAGMLESAGLIGEKK